MPIVAECDAEIKKKKKNGTFITIYDNIGNIVLVSVVCYHIMWLH